MGRIGRTGATFDEPVGREAASGHAEERSRPGQYRPPATATLLDGPQSGQAAHRAAGETGTGLRARQVVKQVPGELHLVGLGAHRSEERRVGKECRSRWSPYHYKKNSQVA